MKLSGFLFLTLSRKRNRITMTKKKQNSREAALSLSLIHISSGLLKILQNLVHLAEADLRTNSLLSRILFPLRLRNPVPLLVQSREPRHQELQKVRVFSLHFLRNNSRRRIWSVSRCSKSQELCRSGRNPSASYHSFYLLRSILDVYKRQDQDYRYPHSNHIHLSLAKS